jgi:predicted negative regulator of RcsB-dependent stress response
MQTIELSQFSQEYQALKVWNNPIEQKIPLQITSLNYEPTHFAPKSTLNTIFPDASEKTKLQKAKNTLGETIKDQTDEQLQTFITESQYLIDSWLNDYEIAYNFSV